MKVTLNLDQLLSEGEITQLEYDKFADLAAKSTGSLAFNILIGFGVLAVSAAALALVPTFITALIIGLSILVLGLGLLRSKLPQWWLLSNICILIGALMTGGGIILVSQASQASILAVTALFAVAGIFARSTLLAVLATLVLSASIGAQTGYFHASYMLEVQAPILTIGLFSAIAIGLYQLSKKLTPDYANIALASARTSVFLVNFGFWVGSLWGERFPNDFSLTANFFALLWALALLATAIWAWRRNRRWVLNTAVTFGGIHFYTQWFENLGASPGTVLIAGLLALGTAVGLRYVNTRMKDSG